MNRMPASFARLLSRAAAGGSVLALLAPLFLAGCPGQCLIRLQTNIGGRTSNRCLVDSCPNGSEFADQINSCQCKEGNVPFQGACVPAADASKSCGVGYQYANGGCVAIACPPGAVFNAQSGACESHAASDQAVAASAGVTLKAGQTLGCPTGYTYVVAGKDGACVPNELTCGTGTRWDGTTCASIACPPGAVFDASTNSCQKLAKGDEKVYSVTAKLKASLGPDFCAPLAKNPSAWKVAPGASATFNIDVTIGVPGREIDKASLSNVVVRDSKGATLGSDYPGVASAQQQVQSSVVTSIRALGGNAEEETATATAVCTIKRAPIQVIESSAGGV
jgi:hypothetical protein